MIGVLPRWICRNIHNGHNWKFFFTKKQKSAQVELIALTWANQWAKGQIANVYADSHYAFEVSHDFGMLWKHQKFIKPWCYNQESLLKILKNGKQVAGLLSGIQLPKQLAIIKIPVHSKSDSMEAKGNQLIDEAAK